uniref:Uncharacterized protein n=2 Tax=Anguilla anguilla TaxID=7936 RepID=A0A0E9QYZ1_ANGAN
MCLQQQMLLKYETQMSVSELWLFLSSLPLSQSMFEPGDGSVMIKSITLTLKETVCPKSTKTT